MQGYDAPDYNNLSDGSMSKIFLMADFGDNIDTLSKERAKTQMIKNAPKISSKNSQGPVPFASQQRKKNVFTSQPNSKKYAKWAKNVMDSQNEFNRFDDDIWAKAEAEANKQQQTSQKIQNDAPKPKQSENGPLAKNKKEDEKI